MFDIEGHQIIECPNCGEVISTSEITAPTEFTCSKCHCDFKELPPSEYYWCLHCECTYKKSHMRKKGGLLFCADKSCDGNLIDAFDWNDFRSGFTSHPDYPEIPEEGKYYPQY